MIDEPVRLADALAALRVPANDSAGKFQAAWDRWVDDSGHRLPLPVGWRTAVGEFDTWGLSAEQVEECVVRAMTADVRRGSSRFAYAIAVARDVAARSHKAHAVERDHNPGAGEFVVNTGSQIVHRPDCYMLRGSSPLNVTGVATTEGFKTCRICLK